MKEKSTLKDVANNYLTHPLKNKGITLITLVITMVLHYDKVKKCSNSNSFLLSSI